MRNRRNWIELGVAAAVFGVLSGLVWALDAPRELVPAIWMGSMLGVAGTSYWRGRGLPSLRRGARSSKRAPHVALLRVLRDQSARRSRRR